MFPIAVDGNLATYCFLNGNSGLSQKDTEYLVKECVRAHITSDKRRNLKGEDFEGVLVREKFLAIGFMAGQGYSAELEIGNNPEKMNLGVVVQKVGSQVFN